MMLYGEVEEVLLGCWRCGEAGAAFLSVKLTLTTLIRPVYHQNPLSMNPKHIN